MVRGLLISADISTPLAIRDFHGLEELQSAVKGFVEAVDVEELGATIYVNEEGLVRHLPFNARASFLWWLHTHRTSRALLVGDAVIVGMPDPAGDDRDVPESLVDLVMAPGPYAVQLTLLEADNQEVSGSLALSSVVLPLTIGDPYRFVSAARYEDSFSAAGWAVALADSSAATIQVRVAPVDAAPDLP